MNLSFFSRKPRARTFPHAKPVTVPVNVTVTERDAPVDAIPFTRDPLLAAQIRNNLPNRPVSHELRACRMAAVLDRLASFLEDETGDVSMPEKPEAIKALRFGAEHLRDGIVIGGAR
jgi:hypothetical protein